MRAMRRPSDTDTPVIGGEANSNRPREVNYLSASAADSNAAIIKKLQRIIDSSVFVPEEPHYQPLPEGRKAVPYRDAVCGLCEKTVSLALDVSLRSLQARTRSTADVALARQIAMYLCHTTFSLLHTEVGLHFQRDRTTVAHACKTIEDKRDDLSFDVLMCQLEALLLDARHAAESTYFGVGCGKNSSLEFEL